MFLHPNQLRFAAGQVPGVAALQAVISRPEHRDLFRLRVLLHDGADPAGTIQALEQSVQSLCRVRVDEVTVVEKGQIGPNDPAVTDERTWD